MNDLALVTNLLYRCPNFHLLLLTFKTALLVAVNDPATGQIVWAELHRHSITGQDADKILPHASRNVRQNLVLVLKLDFKHRVGQRLNYRCHYFNRVFLRQTLSRFRPQAFVAYCVKITAPSAVTATVCSK